MKLLISSVFVATVLECGVSGLTLHRSNSDSTAFGDLSKHQEGPVRFNDLSEYWKEDQKEKVLREIKEAENIKKEAEILEKKIAHEKTAAAEASACAYIAGRDAAHIASAAARSASEIANEAIEKAKIAAIKKRAASFAAENARISKDFHKLRNYTSRSKTRTRKENSCFGEIKKKVKPPSVNSGWKEIMDSPAPYPKKLSKKAVKFADEKDGLERKVEYVTSGVPSKILQKDVAAEEEEEELPPGCFYDEKENIVKFDSDSSMISPAVQEDHSTSPPAKNTSPAGILNRNSARAAADQAIFAAETANNTLDHLKYFLPFLKTMRRGIEIDENGTVLKLKTDEGTKKARFVIKVPRNPYLYQRSKIFRKVTHKLKKATMKIIDSIDVSDVASIEFSKNENEEYTLYLKGNYEYEDRRTNTFRCKTNITNYLTIRAIISGLENIKAIYNAHGIRYDYLHLSKRGPKWQYMLTDRRGDRLFSTWISDLLSESKNTAVISEAE